LNAPLLARWTPAHTVLMVVRLMRMLSRSDSTNVAGVLSLLGRRTLSILCRLHVLYDSTQATRSHASPIAALTLPDACSGAPHTVSARTSLVNAHLP
jgi:hypothetical protein